MRLCALISILFTIGLATASEFTDGKPESASGTDIISIPGKEAPRSTIDLPPRQPVDPGTSSGSRSLSFGYLYTSEKTVNDTDGYQNTVIEVSSSQSNIIVNTPSGYGGILAVKGILEYDYQNYGTGCYKDGYCTRSVESDAREVGEAVCESQGLRYSSYNGSRVLVANHRGLSGYQIELDLGTRDYSGSQYLVRVRSENGRIVSNGSRSVTSQDAYISVGENDVYSEDGRDIWLPVWKVFCVR